MGLFDMFDFNRDGMTDPGEFAMGMLIMDEMEKKEQHHSGNHDNDDEQDDNKR